MSTDGFQMRSARLTLRHTMLVLSEANRLARTLERIDDISVMDWNENVMMHGVGRKPLADQSAEPGSRCIRPTSRTTVRCRRLRF